MMPNPGYYAQLVTGGMKFEDMLALYERDLILHLVTLDSWDDDAAREQ